MSKISAELFRQMLIQKRKQMPQKVRNQKRVKTVAQPYPWAIEKEMADWLKNTVLKPVFNQLKQELSKENYERWLVEYSKHDSTDSNTHLDSYSDEISRLIGKLKIDVDKRFSGDSNAIKEKLLKTAVSEFIFTKKNFLKQTETILGTPFSTDEAWWEKTRKAWMDENFTLIKSQPEEIIKKINNEVYAGVRNGTGWGELQDRLQIIDDQMTDNKSRLIARDQVGKLNGQLSKYRQTEIGLNYYTWQTAGDERVRGDPSGRFPNALYSHYLMDDGLCNWNDSSIVSWDNGKTWVARPGNMIGYIPGSDIQCRCSAIAWFGDLIDDVDQSIDNPEPLFGRVDSAESPVKKYGVDDTLLHPEILVMEMNSIFDSATIDNTYDVPYLAGYSKDKKTIYIDRHMPRYLDWNGKKWDVYPLSVGHERREDILEFYLKLSYQEAHQDSLQWEKNVCEAMGLDWNAYDAFCQQWIKYAYSENMIKVPPDLELKPYKDENDYATIKAIINGNPDRSGVIVPDTTMI